MSVSSRDPFVFSFFLATGAPLRLFLLSCNASAASSRGCCCNSNTAAPPSRSPGKRARRSTQSVSSASFSCPFTSPAARRRGYDHWLLAGAAALFSPPGLQHCALLQVHRHAITNENDKTGCPAPVPCCFFLIHWNTHTTHTGTIHLYVHTNGPGKRPNIFLVVKPLFIYIRADVSI